MSEKIAEDREKSRITNPEILTTTQQAQGSKCDEDKQDDPFSSQLQESKYPSPEKVLKIVVVTVLFMVVIGSGSVARITLHILIWHILPPKQSENSTLNTLGGLLQRNCTACMGNASCTSDMESSNVDINWIWAVFLVITTPYFLTFLSTLFRICFKTNKPLKMKALLVVMFVETLNTVGVSIFAFLVLPSFDPASASVAYLAVVVIPPLLDVAGIVQNKNNRCLKLSEIMLSLSGLALQVAGIILIGIYINIGWLVGLFVMSAIFVCIKYWENFVAMGKPKFLDNMKRDLQEGKSKVTCLVNLWKIFLTFLSVIVIFVSKTPDSTAGLNALFNNGKSNLNSVFGGYRELGESDTCKKYIPFIVAVINIVCSYICYKGAKAACTIYSQRIGLSIPIIIIPIISTFSLVGMMTNPNGLKYTSCDILFSDWCLQSLVGLEEKGLELIISFVLLYLSVLIITRHIWKSNGYRHGETARIFVSPFYCGMFLDLSLLLNRRRHDKEYDIIYGKDYKEQSQRAPTKRLKLYACCATMWHETSNEMTQLLKSLFRLDKRQMLNDLLAKLGEDADTVDQNIDEATDEAFDFEAHIFFDDAFDPIKEGEQYPDVNEYVKEFIRVLNVAGSIVHGKTIQIPDGEMFRTPYGGRIEFKLPAENDLIVHLKDKSKIRHKKRWSQVMYMFYILKWKLQNSFKKSQFEMQEAAENTFLLALDGDVDFEPEAVLSLVRRMKKSPLVGAACGRIHPIGSGPMVWYQKFEYAVSHWLQKATEHVIGCVLCSPGCFSLFRGSAILNTEVLEKYTTVASEAQHFVQYDQGEDRWLCTLMLKQGWRVEYCAESDSYTFAPEGFYEFFNQRRRWTPSTLANILDLIMDWKVVTRNNQNISLLYICYHMFLFISTLLTPGTIFMIILGAIIAGFESVPPWLALVLNIVPVGIFLLMCLYTSTQRQLQYAAILSSVYVLVMMVVLIGVIRDAVEEGLCSITTIFIIFVAGVFVVSAILHPREFLCLIPGLLYFVAIPSMCMILFFYSIGNLHVVSWGTRETKQNTKPKETKQFVPEREEKGHFFSLGNFFSCICCPTNSYTKEDFLYKIMTDRIKDLGFNRNHTEHTEDLKEAQQIDNEQTQIQGTSENTETDQVEKKSKDKEKKSKDELHYYFNENVPKIQKYEAKFWKKTIKKYLKPLEKDEEKEKAIQEELLDLRNRVCLFVFLLNSILVTVMYGLTQVNSFQNSLTVSFKCGGNNVDIVPIAVLFTVVFGLLLLLQFLCMLYHRFSTLLHIMAETDIKDSKKAKENNLHFKFAEMLLSPSSFEATHKIAKSDKNKSVLDKNRSVLFPEEQKPVTRLEEFVEKNMVELKNLEGSLKGTQKKLGAKVLNKWMSKVKFRNVAKSENKANMQKFSNIVKAAQLDKSKHKLNPNQIEPLNNGKASRKMSDAGTSDKNDFSSNPTYQRNLSSIDEKTEFLGNDSNV